MFTCLALHSSQAVRIMPALSSLVSLDTLSRGILLVCCEVGLVLQRIPSRRKANDPP